MERIIGRCGIICSECPAYIATQANDRAALERMAKEASKQLNRSITAEAGMCDGCLTTTGRIGQCVSECEVHACAVERDVLSCAYCDEYGCAKITGFLKEMPEAKATLEEIRASR